MSRKPNNILKVLEDKLLISNGCWEWTGIIDRDGYGLVTYKNKLQRVHRLVYELMVDSIPPKMQIDHTCHTKDRSCPGGKSCKHRRCANPSHLEIVDNQENVSRREERAKKTHCPKGHPYSGENLYEHKGKRSCKRCQLDSNRRFRARQKGYNGS